MPGQPRTGRGRATPGSITAPADRAIGDRPRRWRIRHDRRRARPVAGRAQRVAPGGRPRPDGRRPARRRRRTERTEPAAPGRPIRRGQPGRPLRRTGRIHLIRHYCQPAVVYLSLAGRLERGQARGIRPVHQWLVRHDLKPGHPIAADPKVSREQPPPGPRAASLNGRLRLSVTPNAPTHDRVGGESLV